MDKILTNKKQPEKTRKKKLKKDIRSMWTVQGFRGPTESNWHCLPLQVIIFSLPVVTFLPASRERYERRKNRDGALIQGSWGVCHTVIVTHMHTHTVTQIHSHAHTYEDICTHTHNKRWHHQQRQHSILDFPMLISGANAC